MIKSRFLWYVEQMYRRVQLGSRMPGFSTLGFDETSAADLQKRSGEAVQTGLALWTDSEGSQDRSALSKSFEATLGMPDWAASLAARTVVKGAIAAHKWEQAESGGLEYFWVHGSPSVNSPPMDRFIVDKVYHRSIVQELSNGMLDPVSLMSGGWGSNMSFQPVNPEWDKELALKVVKTSTDIESIPWGPTDITVAGSRSEISRLQQQIFLEEEGVDIFVNAKTNESGFVGCEHEWWCGRFSARGRLRRELDMVFDQAKERSEAGDHVVLRVDQVK